MKFLTHRVCWMILAATLLAQPLYAAQGGGLKFRMTGEPATLDWNRAHSSLETYIIMNLMEGLTEEGADLKPRPALAEKWDVSEDGKTYTFKLRSGVKWSDGQPLRAADFEESWIRLLSPKTKSEYAHFLFDIDNAEAFHAGKIKDRAAVGIKAVDDSTFQVRLRRRVPYFLHLPTFWVTFPVRADLIQKHGDGWAKPGKIVTLGPYLLDSWKRGKEIVLKGNPSYFGAKAPVERVTAVIEPGESKARKLFKDGAVDFLLNATTQDLLSFKSQVRQFPYLATYYVGFNAGHSLLKDPELRKAIAAGLDREGVPAAMQGGQQQAPSWVPAGMEGYTPYAFSALKLYDARAVLAKLGYVDGRGFPPLSLWVERIDGAEALGALLAKGLNEKLGIQVSVRVGSPSEFKSAMASGKADLFVRHWGADYPEPSNFLEVFMKGSGGNHTGWTSVAYDALLERAREAATPVARAEAYLEAERMLVEKESVIVPLFYSRNTVLLGSRVKDFTISPLNYLFLKGVSLQ